MLASSSVGMKVLELVGEVQYILVEFEDYFKEALQMLLSWSDSLLRKTLCCL